jgi:hypothetical protein
VPLQAGVPVEVLQVVPQAVQLVGVLNVMQAPLQAL